MNQFTPLNFPTLPAIVATAGEGAAIRFLEFFASHGRWGPFTWCEVQGVASIAAVQPLHVAAWIELQMRERATPSVKQQLATIRHLFDWLVTDQVIPTNPATSVRGSSHIVQRGKTPVLEPAEAGALLTRTPLPQANAYAMIGRWALAAGIDTKLGNHSFRATGITAYLKNGGTLEKATAMASHASTRTTQLYDRRHDEMRSNGAKLKMAEKGIEQTAEEKNPISNPQISFSCK